MKNLSLLKKIKKNIFINISDDLFNKLINFTKKNDKIISLDEILSKIMIMDFVIPYVKTISKNDKILEIGCGSGIHSCILSDYGKVYATDLKYTTSALGITVNENRQNILEKLNNNKIDFKYNDGVSLPFEDNTFKIIFHNSVIEHVPDIKIFNKEVYRILKPGGFCICITGTPILSLYRFFRYYILRFPLIFIHALLKSTFKTKISDLNFMKKIYFFINKRIWHFQPTDILLLDILKKKYNINCKPSKLDNKLIKQMYPKIIHFIREPDYNSILLDNISRKNNIEPSELLLQWIQHFQSPYNEFTLNINPQTHSQHTLNYKTEINEWRVKNWIKSFEEVSFEIKNIRGYRYQYLFGMMYNILTHFFYPLIKIFSRILPASISSEFILIAEKSEKK